MNTASKSKSKELPSPNSAKEQQKAYDPVSGTFHRLDEREEHTADYDSLSNCGSSSGESEDHKDKPASTTRQETIPGSDNDKREKIRLKNEKKHQRQREKRAQELHERCTGYLMSRKLDSLSQQLVAMGFSAERATLALMLNEGRLEESVNWLFEGNEEAAKQKGVASGANLKLDISEELARVAAMVVRYKCSKQEVERAVVSCEGDLEMVEETLRTKPDPPIVPPKPEKPAATTVTAQPIRNEINNSSRGMMLAKPLETGSRSLQPTTSQLNLLSEKRWAVAGSSSVAEKVVAQSNDGGGNEGRNIRVREPVIMMQRPQLMNIKQNLVATAAYANKAATVETLMLNRKVLQNQSIGGFHGSRGPENLTFQHLLPQSHNSRNIGPENLNAQPYYPQTQYMQHRSHASGSVNSALASLQRTWSAVGAQTPSINSPSSLGLFSGWGSTGAQGHADWNARGEVIYNCDYNKIDWTLECTGSPPKASRPILGLRNAGGSNGRHAAGFRDGGVPMEPTTVSSGFPCEWTSPFAGKDIFSLPRQFVTYPSP
ncbi:hypothetical protein LguiA_010783 [Lonicera macranthoides]